MRHAFIAASLLAGLAAPAMAQVSQANLQAAAEAIGKSYDQSYNGKSASGMGALYTEDAEFVAPSGTIHGRTAIEAYYQSRFAAGAAGHLTKILEVHPYGDGGYGIGQFSATVPTPNGERREVHGNIVALYKHDGNTWRMRLLVPQFAPPAPAPMKTTNSLSEEVRPGASRKLSGKETALLIATACSNPPEGRKRWTLDLLAGAMIRLTEHEGLSRETVRRRLAEDDLKPWRRDMWCIPQVDGTYVARMEDVLDLYAEAADPKRPVVCFDESPTQLIGEVRQPIPAGPGQPERYDCEYHRNGTANLFVFLDAHRSWRHVKVTDQRTSVRSQRSVSRSADHDPSRESATSDIIPRVALH